MPRIPSPRPRPTMPKPNPRNTTPAFPSKTKGNAMRPKKSPAKFAIGSKRK